MADKDEAIKLLRSIDGTLRRISNQLGVLGQTNGPDVADDRDLDGKYGDPEVRFLPRDWTGDDYKHYRFSECPPALLDLLAEAFDYFARKAEETGEEYKGKPTAPYKRKDAARARGWAKRLRAGWKPAAPSMAVDESTGEILEDPGAPAPGFADSSEWPAEDDIPF